MNNLPFRTLRNARDFAGICTEDGRKIKGKVMIRSAYLYKISHSDADKLFYEYNLRHVIDLRSESEREKRPETMIQGTEYLIIPYFNESTLGMTGGMGTDVLSALKKAKNFDEMLAYVPDLTDVYPLMAEDDFSVSKISEVVRFIMNNRNGSVIFHCTAGKDRTGVTAAILLKILGVPDETICEDYTYTNLVSGVKARKVSRLGQLIFRNPELTEKIEKAYLADVSNLKLFFNKIDEKYGTFDNFIHTGLGITDEEINSFKDYILE